MTTWGQRARRVLRVAGIDARRVPRARLPWEREAQDPRELVRQHNLDAIHFACGTNVHAPPWINVDGLAPPVRAGTWSVRADLTARLPFDDATFRFGYSEDFIEHLTQSEALSFLSEAHRVLQPGGVLRLSTPSLEGVLRRHYRRTDWEGARVGAAEAYDPYGHVHFFSRGSLEAVARHLGFSAVEDVAFGASRHERLRGVDTRAHQVDLNLLVELTR